MRAGANAHSAFRVHCPASDEVNAVGRADLLVVVRCIPIMRDGRKDYLIRGKTRLGALLSSARAQRSRLMHASGRLREPVLHRVEDEIDPLVNPELSVDRG
jgi:hypothetical protein